MMLILENMSRIIKFVPNSDSEIILDTLAEYMSKIIYMCLPYNRSSSEPCRRDN